MSWGAVAKILWTIKKARIDIIVEPTGKRFLKENKTMKDNTVQ